MAYCQTCDSLPEKLSSELLITISVADPVGANDDGLKSIKLGDEDVDVRKLLDGDVCEFKDDVVCSLDDKKVVCRSSEDDEFF